MDVNQLQELLNKGENPKLELKSEWYNIEYYKGKYKKDAEAEKRYWGEILKDLVGLANGNIGYVGETAYMIVGAEDKDPEMGETRATFNIDESKIYLSSKVKFSLQKFKEILIKRFCSTFNTASWDINADFVQLSEDKKLLVIEIKPPIAVLELVVDLLTNGQNYRKGTVLIRAGQDITVAGQEEIIALKSQYDKLDQTSPQKVKQQNLPQPHYEFIGREEDFAEAMRIIYSRYPLVTIDGVGGIGKTALALEIAHHFFREHDKLQPEERFDALIWTSAKQTVLRPGRGIVTRKQALRTLDDICDSIAVTLKIEDKIGSDRKNQVEIINRYLSKQRTLLIVDNLETVDDEAVIEFLQDIPIPTKAIVTTRHRIDAAYPVRLVGMKWEESKILIEQECLKKEVTLSEEQKKKLHDRTGGIPLAMVWNIAKIGFGYSAEGVLATLGNPKGDLARFCFEGAVEAIKNTDAYKLLLVLALFINYGSREELGYVAGFADDVISRDEGLVKLEKLSLVNKKADQFNMLPLTREYVEYELELNSSFASEAVSRLIDYYLELHQLSLAGQYLVNHKSKLSIGNLEKLLDLVERKSWQMAYSYMNDEEWSNEDPYYIYEDVNYTCLECIKIMEAIGGTEGTQKLKNSWGDICNIEYCIDVYFEYFGIVCRGNPLVHDCINALARLNKYDLLIELLENKEERRYFADELIQAIDKSGRKDLIKPLNNILSTETDSLMVAKLQQAIEHLESAN